MPKTKNELSKAINYLQHSITILKQVYTEDHPDFGNTFYRLAKTYLKFQYLDSAEHYLKLSLDANYMGKLSDSIDYHLVLDEIQFLETLFEMAGLYYRRHVKENNFELLHNSLKCFKKGAEMVTYLVSGFHIEASKLKLLEKASGYYDEAMTAAEEFYINQGNEEGFSQMLAFSEQTKAMALYQSMIKSQLKTDDSEGSLRVKYQNLLGRINYLKNKILQIKENGKDSALLNVFEVELARKIIEFQNLNEQIENEGIQKQYVSFSSKGLVEKLQQSLSVDEVMLEYFVTDSLLFCFVIGADFYEVKKTPAGQGFKNEVLDYFSIIRKHRFKEFSGMSYSLYERLIGPVEHYLIGKSKLIIIPDSYLLFMPFCSLLFDEKSSKGSPDFSELSYFIKKHEIVYQYSANLWLESRQLNTTINEKSFLGLAPFAAMQKQKPDDSNLSFFDPSLQNDVLRATSNQNNEFLPLPYSGKELVDISKLFIEENMVSKTVFNNQAKESFFKTKVKDYRLVHIATHSIINDNHPELSGIAFYNSPKSDNQADTEAGDWKDEQTMDGILFTGEIYGLDVNADLVVLSACETGIGKLSKGEGVLSLTRGFLYNKVPNLIYSLWKINDKSTCTLMTKFYENLLQGASYSCALQSAQISLIADKSTAFPSNWAAFCLIGR
ncbi:MAG: CHAT domain-containing protein [Chloroflexia bacterium]|nr:CHAT domain-containing protein [Chloroflexia bacterium]